MKPVVLVDVDGVLSGFVSSYLRAVYRETGRQYSYEDVTQYDMKRALGLNDLEAANVASHVQTPGFCEDIPVLEGATDGVRRLQEIAEVYIVTAPWNANRTWTYEREKWLARNFGIPSSRVIHTHAKHLVTGDILVDDKTDTIRKWSETHPGTAVLWECPWNIADEWSGPRTNNWDDVCNLVAGMTSRTVAV